MPGTQKTKPFCTVPFVEGFSGMSSDYRNCCVASPQIHSMPGQTFEDWWHDPRLQQFRDSMYTQQWPTECQGCRVEEAQHGSSLRTVVNDTINVDINFGKWPSRWNLKFGNVCNLACWTCNEHASSVIAQHKHKIGILPESFVDPEHHFQLIWPDLEAQVLKSYQHHDVVTLTLLGGEPLYNKTVAMFLNKLIDLNLAGRTRLEFHTNGTHTNPKLFLNKPWKYVCVFLSLDAVGKKAEWLRYGCRWNDIESNIDFFKKSADYVEVHCTVSVLNVNDLPALDQFCQAHGLTLKTSLLTNPEFMSLQTWPGDPNLLAPLTKTSSFYGYYVLIGSAPNSRAGVELDRYISGFDAIRKNLANFDAKLAHAIKVSAH